MNSVRTNEIYLLVKKLGLDTYHKLITEPWRVQVLYTQNRSWKMPYIRLTFPARLATYALSIWSIIDMIDQSFVLPIGNMSTGDNMKSRLGNFSSSDFASALNESVGTSCGFLALFLINDSNGFDFCSVPFWIAPCDGVSRPSRSSSVSRVDLDGSLLAKKSRSSIAEVLLTAEI